MDSNRQKRCIEINTFPTFEPAWEIRPGIHPQVLHRRMKSVTYFGRSVPGGGGGQGVNILQPHSHDGCARGHEKNGGSRRIDIESFSSMWDALSLYQKKFQWVTKLNVERNDK